MLFRRLGPGNGQLFYETHVSLWLGSLHVVILRLGGPAMKLILYLLLVFAFVLPGCSPSSDTTPVTEAPAASAPAEPEGPIPAGQVPASYIDAADALFNGDFDRAKGSLAAMAAETTGELQTRTQAAAAAPDLATMRQEFKKVSDIAARME